MWMNNNRIVIPLTEKIGAVVPKKLVDHQLALVRREVSRQMFYTIIALADLCWVEWLAAPSWVLVFLALVAILSFLTGLYGWKNINTITKYRMLAMLHQFMKKHCSDDEKKRSVFFTRIRYR